MSEARPLGRVGSRLYDGLGYVGGAILAVMAGAVFVQVVARYVFARAIDGIDEVPRYLFVWLVMIGAAAAARALERAGIIRRYAAVLDPLQVGLGLLAYVTVKLEKRGDDLLDNFCRAHGVRKGNFFLHTCDSVTL